jgi:hypothetical protein
MEATKNRPNETSRGTANNCESCGANFPSGDALERHMNIAHHSEPNPAGAPGESPRGEKGAGPEGTDQRANNSPSKPGGKGREQGSGGPAGRSWDGEGPSTSGSGVESMSADRESGGSKKDGQVPYGSHPPRRDKGLDEGRTTGVYKVTPSGSEESSMSGQNSKKPAADRGSDQDRKGPPTEKDASQESEDSRPNPPRDHRPTPKTESHAY